MADLSVLVDAETLLDREFIYGAARFVQSQAARTTGLREAQVELTDTVTVLLTTLLATPSPESVTVGTTTSSRVDLYGLGATVKVQDTVVAVLGDNLAIVVATETVRLDAAGFVDLLGLGATVKVQDTVTAQLIGGTVDLSVTVPSEPAKVADSATVLENPLLTAVGGEVLHVQDTVAAIFGNTLAVIVAVEPLSVADLQDANYAELVADEGIRLIDQLTVSMTGSSLLSVAVADEPLKVADTVSALENPLVTTVTGESLKVQDTATPALQLAGAVGDEPLKLSDTLTVSLTVLLVSLGDERLHVQDQVLTGNDLVVVVSDSLKVVDTVTSVEDPLQTSTPAESLKVQDTVLASSGGLVAPVADESLKLADTVTVLLNPLGAAALEALVVADAVTTSENPLQTSTPSEALKVQDVVTAAIQVGTTLTESLKVADTVAVSLGLDAGLLAESCRIQDTVTARLTTLVVQATESLKVQDTLAVFGDLLSVYVADEGVHVQDFAYATPAVAVVTIQVQPRPSVIQVQARPRTIQVIEP